MERLEIIISPNMESLLPQVPVSKTEQVNVQVNVSLEQKLFFVTASMHECGKSDTM